MKCHGDIGSDVNKFFHYYQGEASPILAEVKAAGFKILEFDILGHEVEGSCDLLFINAGKSFS